MQKTKNMNKKIFSLTTTLLLVLLFASCGARGGNNAAKNEDKCACLGGVMINGVCWATRNVDAPGTFTENPEDAGLFFQWNRKKGWNVTEEEGWWSSETTIIWGTEWYAENDPCPQGWRVPTRRELEQLQRASSEWTNKNGVYGRLFGTAPNQIFLPAAKSLRGGRFVHLLEHGSYWSRTQNNRSRDSVAWSFTFDASDYLWVIAMHKSLGYNIRCVAK